LVVIQEMKERTGSPPTQEMEEFRSLTSAEENKMKPQEKIVLKEINQIDFSAGASRDKVRMMNRTSTMLQRRMVGAATTISAGQSQAVACGAALPLITQQRRGYAKPGGRGAAVERPKKECTYRS
jgi:hypothetical protein